MNIKLTEATTLNAKDIKFTVDYREYKKNALLGFVSISISEKDQVTSFFSKLQIIKAKSGSLFIKEPVEYGKKSNGEPDYEKEYKLFMLPKAYKELAVKMIEEKLNEVSKNNL